MCYVRKSNHLSLQCLTTFSALRTSVRFLYLAPRVLQLHTNGNGYKTDKLWEHGLLACEFNAWVLAWK